MGQFNLVCQRFPGPEQNMTEKWWENYLWNHKWTTWDTLNLTPPHLQKKPILFFQEKNLNTKRLSRFPRQNFFKTSSVIECHPVVRPRDAGSTSEMKWDRGNPNLGNVFPKYYSSEWLLSGVVGRRVGVRLVGGERRWKNSKTFQSGVSVPSLPLSLLKPRPLRGGLSSEASPQVSKFAPGASLHLKKGNGSIFWIKGET